MSATQFSVADTEARPLGTESDFSALLSKEFKPKSDRAREAIEASVHTLAQHALADTTLISDDSLRSIQNMIAAIDAKLTDQVNIIITRRSSWRWKVPGAACIIW